LENQNTGYSKDNSFPPSREPIIRRADPWRQARILWLARSLDKKNILPDRLCRCGLLLFAASGLLSVLFWGMIFANKTQTLRFGLGAVLLFGVPVLAATYIRQAYGLASWIHRFKDPVLTLAGDRIVLELTRRQARKKRAEERFCWTMLYSGIKRIDYDRTSKILRVYGAFDPAGSRTGSMAFLPEGMKRRNVESANRNQALEIPLYFSGAESILPDLQERSGVYIRPAVRGDDLADLRDLPGLKREKELAKPVGLLAAAVTLAVLASALFIDIYHRNSPYMPYPQTEDKYLSKAFGLGDDVVLDGCEITLSKSILRIRQNGNEVCFRIILELLNTNSSAIHIKAGNGGNLALTAVLSSGETEKLEITDQPPRGYLPQTDQPLPQRLEPEKLTNAALFFWMPDNADEIILEIDSDNWPADNPFRDIKYTGGVNARGQKTNQVKFSIKKGSFP